MSVGAVAALGTVSLASSHKAAGMFHYVGMYVEGCSCSAPCPCELTGVSMGCEGVGFFQAKAGSSYMGHSFAGARMAYATSPGKYVVIYIDAPSAKERQAMEGFARAALGGFGKIEAVKDAKIAIAGSGGNYMASIDGGNICTFSSKMMKGGNNKGPMVYSNIHDPVHPIVMQGTTTSCKFSDGEHKFDLKDSNAYYNPSMHSNGKI
ncbi:MAG: hypothetical protein JSS72_04130 [Armatimonadetes bacterium]|nr:hypothetical protein [Armatimonadota bacterium]